MAPAAIRAFETVELLEILLKAPAKDVLLSQRVNRTWLLTVTNSIKLQRHLFFRPKGGQSVRYFDDRYAKEFFPTYLLEQERPAREITAEYEVRMNPMIGMLYEKLRRETIGGKLRSQLPLGWRLNEASWRRMLLTQPPVHDAVLVLGLPIRKTKKDAWILQESFVVKTEVMRLGAFVQTIDDMYTKIRRHHPGRFALGKYVRIFSESVWVKEGLNVSAEVLDYSGVLDSL